MKSLKARGTDLSQSTEQLRILENKTKLPYYIPFQQRMEEINLYPLKTSALEIFQINIGKMCNQTCKHCHVDAGPDRKEIMTRETMLQCLKAIEISGAHTVDLTGGAPEMNPEFRWFVEELFKLGKKIIVRCNLTIILANKKYHDLPDFFKKHKVEVVSSLPFYNSDKTDSQRGGGVFETSIKALKMLNDVGYGKESSDLILNLVYNPSGAFLPAAQAGLERQFKRVLMKDYGIEFNTLFAITNMPISRFLEYLIESGNYEEYMEKLVNQFNPSAAEGLMCRNTISVSWDGYLYDCDFNQMLELNVEAGYPQHVSEFDAEALAQRDIVLKQHCYGCTAGAGSGCQGATA